MNLSKLHLHWRVSKRGKKEYRSYSLARAYREDGKNRKEIVVKLGPLSADEVDYWRTALRLFKAPTATLVNPSDLVPISNLSYLDVAVALETWNAWELNTAFNSIEGDKNRGVPLASLAAILAINRCFDPASKHKACSWVKKTTLPTLLGLSSMEINSARIYRELPYIEMCKDQLAQHICTKVLRDDPKSVQSVFYDLSSTTFTGTRCILTKWGHCKEGYEYHIVLALIVNTKGLPIYWEVLEGGTADATTISWLLDRLKKKLSAAIPVPTMVFDRGMVSDENLDLLEKDKIKYISAMDKNQIESITKINFCEFTRITVENVKDAVEKLPDFVKLDENTYCKEACVVGERRYILCFNPQLFADQKNAREEQLARFHAFTKLLNDELLKAQMDRDKKSTQEKFDSYLRKAKLKGFVKIELEEMWIPKKTKKMIKAIRTYQGKASIEEKDKLVEGRLDGFWLLVTNLSERENGNFIQNTSSVVQPYRNKVVIESSFRDIKSFIEIAPVHVWKTEHVKAHYTICVLAHLIDRTLALTLHETSRGISEEVVSHERLYEELDGCRLNHYQFEGLEQNFYKLTKPTNMQMDLLKRLRMTHLVNDSIVKKMTTQKITSTQ